MSISKTNDQNNRNLKFLVIDDDRSIQNLMDITLRSFFFNCKVFKAESGDEGIIAAHNYLFDLIFTDIDLPGINGINVANIIRNQTNFKSNKTPIIAISGNLEAREACFKVGINAFLAKPFSNESLKAKLKQFSFLPKI